jgi:hypothetical protein
MTFQTLVRVNLGRLIPSRKPGQYLSNLSTTGTYLTAKSFRLSLEFKRSAYTTAWVEYPNIERLCKEIGANATSYDPDGNPHFTLPVIRDASTNAVVSDSIEIARYLDQTHPSMPLLLPVGSYAMRYAFQDAFASTLDAISPVILLVRCAVLNITSHQYFRRTREATGKRFGTYFSSRKIMGCILAESGRRVWESRRMTWKE